MKHICKRIYPAIASIVLHAGVMSVLFYAALNNVPSVVVPITGSSLSMVLINPVLDTTQTTAEEAHTESQLQKKSELIKPAPPAVTPSPSIVKRASTHQSTQSPIAEKPDFARTEPQSITTKTLINSPPDKTTFHVDENVAQVEKNALPKPINRLQPSYPERARNLGIEGKVVVLFDVDNDGAVHNIRILTAQPKNMFETEVKKAMRQWRYERKAGDNLQLTITFSLEGKATFGP